eukprot:1040599-Pleurochrysis_carterae.AAC.1
MRPQVPARLLATIRRDFVEPALDVVEVSRPATAVRRKAIPSYNPTLYAVVQAGSEYGRSWRQGDKLVQLLCGGLAASFN